MWIVIDRIMLYDLGKQEDRYFTFLLSEGTRAGRFIDIERVIEVTGLGKGKEEEIT